MTTSNYRLVDLQEKEIMAKTKNLHYMAYHLYRDRQYEEASLFFRLLTVVNHDEPKYWKGLGACLQMKQDYSEALNCYIHTQSLYNKQLDPYLYIYAADCYFALNQIDDGLKALEAARLSAPQNAQILKHVALMKTQWESSPKNN
ncbi:MULTISPECIES: tetratricopeptide repeat protein [Candidatus Protochlamydia]|jgi:tetratricopeptide (TPR) repeat protein|nr:MULTISPECIES: tetratricopeptide repeat protein [Protochlamydia]